MCLVVNVAQYRTFVYLLTPNSKHLVGLSLCMLVYTRFLQTIFNSKCEEQQTCPPRDRYGGDPSQRHPKAPKSTGTPGEPSPGLPLHPAEKSRGESQGKHSAATMQKPKGAAVHRPCQRPSTSEQIQSRIQRPDTPGHITP
ncbi:hypothetical protein AMECASPLE_038142 [Ameca splendens]|uniref:Uncharacterized protein n=1 Tax=Ameca splendens TaxID=208324 RepID=A0ABV0YV64_9TELE